MAAVLVARQRRGLEWQNRAAEIKLRAERKAGTLLAEIPREQGRQPEEKTSQRGTFSGAIDDAGIPRQTAHRWQQVAAVPEPEFEQHIAETSERDLLLQLSGEIERGGR